MIFMAIQIPNPGTGNGQTGDNEYVLWSKVKDNFNNSTHAASRLVGEGTNNVMQVGAFGVGSSQSVMITSDDDIALITALKAKGSCFFKNNGVSPATYKYGPSIFLCCQNEVAGISILRAGAGVRVFSADVKEGLDSVTTIDLYHSKSKEIYNTTTASGANTVIDSSGKLMRSTSSERYKDIITDLELDDAAYKNAMKLAPIIYRSTAEADNPDYHYYSFSAEKLGAFDPAFTLWRETETVTDDEGNVTEQPLDERQAEGLNLNAIVAFLHATNIKQDKIIKVQAEAIENLTKRIDAMTAP